MTAAPAMTPMIAPPVVARATRPRVVRSSDPEGCCWDRGDGEDDSSGEQRNAVSAAADWRPDATIETKTVAQIRMARMPTPGNRAVRRADQSRHIAADGRDHESAEDNVGQCHESEHESVTAQAASAPVKVKTSTSDSARQASSQTRLIHAGRQDRFRLTRCMRLDRGALRVKSRSGPARAARPACASDHNAATAMAPAPMKRT